MFDLDAKNTCWALWSKGAGGGRSGLFLVWLLCGSIFFSFPAQGEGGEGSLPRCEVPPGQACIATPSEYRSVWESYGVACVDPSLYVTVPWGYDSPFGGVTEDTHLYPEEFSLAWASGSTNLEKYLSLRCLYADDPIKTRVGIGSYIGFPVPISNKNSSGT